MVAYLKQGYKDSTRDRTEGIAKTGEVSDKGTVTHTDHWDGRLDARVVMPSRRFKLRGVDGAPPSPDFLRAVGEHQQALDDLRIAKAANDRERIAACTRRLAGAKERIEATQ